MHTLHPTIPMETAPEILGDNFRMNQVIPVVGQVESGPYVQDWRQVYYTTLDSEGQPVSNRRILAPDQALYFQQGDDQTGSLVTVGADEVLWEAKMEKDRADRLNNSVRHLNLALSEVASAENQVRMLGGQELFDQDGTGVLAEIQGMIERNGGGVLAAIIAAAKDVARPALSATIARNVKAHRTVHDIMFARLKALSASRSNRSVPQVG
jgi:hypothetical protein